MSAVANNVSDRSEGDLVAGEDMTAPTRDPVPGAAARRRTPRSATVLRWIHLLAGLILSYYFLFKPEGGWSDGFESFVGHVGGT